MRTDRSYFVPQQHLLVFYPKGGTQHTLEGFVLLFQLLTLGILVAEAILATYVATRAWDYRPARFFVLVVTSLMLSTTGTFISEQTTDLRVAYVGQSMAV